MNEHFFYLNDIVFDFSKIEKNEKLINIDIIQNLKNKNVLDNILSGYFCLKENKFYSKIKLNNILIVLSGFIKNEENKFIVYEFNRYKKNICF